MSLIAFDAQTLTPQYQISASPLGRIRGRGQEIIVDDTRNLVFVTGYDEAVGGEEGGYLAIADMDVPQWQLIGPQQADSACNHRQANDGQAEESVPRSVPGRNGNENDQSQQRAADRPRPDRAQQAKCIVDRVGRGSTIHPLERDPGGQPPGAADRRGVQAGRRSR